MQTEIDSGQLATVFDQLYRYYGPQHWWPTTDPDNPRFEILIGAVLTQHTAWTQAEKAIANLRQAGPLTPEAIFGHGEALAEIIRPAGPHNVKAERLRALCRWFIDAGGFSEIDSGPTDDLRIELLKCRGVGAETADAILVYAFQRPLFVADAYAFRLFERLGWTDGQRNYEELRTAIEAAAPEVAGADFYNEFHALIVTHAKTCCHNQRPECGCCNLRSWCDFSYRNL